MYASVDNKSDRPKQFAAQAAVVAARILVKAHFLAKLLRVQRPALGVPGIADMLAELRQPGHLLGDGALHVVTGYPLVIGNRLITNQRAMREIGRRDADPARALTVRGTRLVMGGIRAPEIRNGLDRYR